MQNLHWTKFDADAHYTLATQLYDGTPYKAEKHFLRALSLIPENAEYHFRLATLYHLKMEEILNAEM